MRLTGQEPTNMMGSDETTVFWCGLILSFFGGCVLWGWGGGSLIVGLIFCGVAVSKSHRL